MDSPISIHEINNNIFGLNKFTGEILQFDSLLEAEVFQNGLKVVPITQEVLTDDIDSVTLTIELNYVCNLSCVYCYQADKGSRCEISQSIIDMIIDYASSVYNKCSFKKLFLRFIGGEPLLSMNKLFYCYEKFCVFCHDRNIVLYVHLDTNGTIAMTELICRIPNIDIFVCLSLPDDHNNMRSGSFECILRNLEEVSTLSSESITLRYNISNNNINDFEKFLIFIREMLPNIKSVLTARIDDYYCKSCFTNNISTRDFAIWNSTIGINLLIKHGFPIYHCTKSGVKRCQGYAPYSCKIHSDGMVTVCDAMPHKQADVHIETMIENPSILELVYPSIKTYSPFSDSDCSRCNNLVQCGGKLFCRDNREACDYQDNYVERLFVETFLRHYLNGESHYFINMLR